MLDYLNINIMFPLFQKNNFQQYVWLIGCVNPYSTNFFLTFFG